MIRRRRKRRRLGREMMYAALFADYKIKPT